MDAQGRRLRDRVRAAQRGRSGNGRRYPVDLRHSAGAYARARQAAGFTLSRVARELGVPWQTLRLWADEGRGGGLRPVVVDDAAARTTESGTLTLVTPSGYRVEGLHAGTLVELLRALG